MSFAGLTLVIYPGSLSCCFTSCFHFIPCKQNNVHLTSLWQWCHPKHVCLSGVWYRMIAFVFSSFLLQILTLLLLLFKVGVIWQTGQNHRRFLQDKNNIHMGYLIAHLLSFLLKLWTPVLIELLLNSILWSLACYLGLSKIII